MLFAAKHPYGDQLNYNQTYWYGVKCKYILAGSVSIIGNWCKLLTHL